MNIYYTAKDIEEMAAKGIRQIELGPGVTLTDFARETAQQFNIELIDAGKSAAQQSSAKQPSTQQSSVSMPNRAVSGVSKYQKPRGCQHPALTTPAAGTHQPIAGDNSNTTMNRLIDLMGKAVKRGE